MVGIPDEGAGELPKAFVVPKGEITEGEIIEFVAQRVSPHKKLRGGVEFIEQIPKTASGKILKRELKKWWCKLDNCQFDSYDIKIRCEWYLFVWAVDNFPCKVYLK